MRRIAIVNEKGGVGKTTTAVNLALQLARRQKKVLLIDYDPQGNATMFLGYSGLVDDQSTCGSAQFTLGKAFTPICDVVTPGLDLLPADPELPYLEAALLDMLNGGPRRLANALSALGDRYDYVISDCGPTIGMIATNAIISCPEIIIPVKLAYVSVPGALRLRRHLESLQAAQEPKIRILGVLPTFFNVTAKAPREVMDHLKSLFGRLVFNTAISTRQAVENAAGMGKPISALDPADRVAQEYNKIAEEVINRG